jgi:D-glycero-alpha-D-manno-heptose-7-phosphate kinase
MRRAGVEGLRLTMESDFPYGAGLGGSSAAGVAAVGAIAELRGHPLERSALAEASRTVEVEDLGIAGGRQDHYAAAYGGALALSFTASGSDVEQIPLDADTIAAIERRLVIAFTGRSRISSATITAVLDGYRARDTRVVGALARTKALAQQMATALRAGSLDDLGALVAEQWVQQKALHYKITTPLIDELASRAHAAGAIGVKALGASGGGCVLAIAKEDSAERVRTEMGTLAEILPFEIDTQGFQILESER